MRSVIGWILKVVSPGARKQLAEFDQVQRELEEFLSPEAEAARARDRRERRERLLTIPDRYRR